MCSENILKILVIRGMNFEKIAIEAFIIWCKFEKILIQDSSFKDMSKNDKTCLGDLVGDGRDEVKEIFI